MKIGIDISQIVYQTGVSRYTVELVQHLLKNDDRNHYWLYAGSLRQRKILKAFLAKIKTKKTSHKLTYLSPKLADIFWNKLNIFKPGGHQDLDLFHASNWAIPKIKTKLVTTIHDLTFLKYPQEHLPYYIKAHTRHLKRAEKYADRIIAVSQSTKKDLINQGIPEAKITVIYSAPAQIFKPLKSKSKLKSIKAKYGLKGPYLLSVGTQEPRKNLPRLIKAYQKLETKRMPLAIAGKFGWGDRTQPIKGVKLLNFVPDEDLVGLYSAAKAFIYPSLYEGFGFPVLEALACGCPVITSNTSSLPELGGQAALYVNPKKTTDITQAIKILLGLNSAKRHQLVNKGLQQAQQFSWSKTAQQTLKLYQEVAKC